MNLSSKCLLHYELVVSSDVARLMCVWWRGRKKAVGELACVVSRIKIARAKEPVLLFQMKQPLAGREFEKGTDFEPMFFSTSETRRQRS